MKRPLILPSIMCEKPWQMKEYVKAFEESGITAIHFDVMDGHYVANIMCGTDDFSALQTLSKLPIDVHLMATEPDRFVDYFAFREGDWCSFHPEVCVQPYRLLDNLKERGVRAGYALSPAVSCDYVENSLGALDFVLVMSISPGFSGQTMNADHLTKLARLHEIVSQADHPIDLIVDGNTIVPNAKRMLAAGATGLVVGSSTLLKEGPEHFEENYERYVMELGQP